MLFIFVLLHSCLLITLMKLTMNNNRLNKSLEYIAEMIFYSLEWKGRVAVFMYIQRNYSGRVLVLHAIASDCKSE